jgi:hypothetical protein
MRPNRYDELTSGKMTVLEQGSLPALANNNRYAQRIEALWDR